MRQASWKRVGDRGSREPNINGPILHHDVQWFLAAGRSGLLNGPRESENTECTCLPVKSLIGFEEDEGRTNIPQRSVEKVLKHQRRYAFDFV